MKIGRSDTRVRMTDEKATQKFTCTNTRPQSGNLPVHDGNQGRKAQSGARRIGPTPLPAASSRPALHGRLPSPADVTDWGLAEDVGIDRGAASPSTAVLDPLPWPTLLFHRFVSALMHRSQLASPLSLLLICTALLLAGCDSAGSNGGDPPPSDPTDPAEELPGTIDGTIRSDSTLTADQDYVVSGLVSVEDGATLTIEPGADLRFEAGAGLLIGSNSVLSADGRADAPIRMTATEGNEEAGWWAGIGIYSGNANNLLNHVEVRHGGGSVAGNSLEAANVIVGVDAALTLTNSTIAESAAYGLYLDKAEADLDAFSNNTFADNADAPVYIPFSEIGDLDSGSSFPSRATVQVRGTVLSADATVDSLQGDTPYRFTNGNAVIRDGATLTVHPGVEMTFASGLGLVSNATLSAEGTAANPITMTATAGNEEAGWWAGIGIY